jgi:flagellar biosynthesis protein FlhG
MDSKRLLNAMIITSGKGGVGKTWFSVNLAHALGNKKKRVLLFDGDLGLSNVDVQLGLKPKRDLGSVLKKKCTFEDAILTYKPNVYTKTSVDIIAGRTIDGAFTVVPKTGIPSLKGSLAAVSPKYDHMILDLSAGLDQIIQEFSTFAQQCLVVVTDGPTSLADALAFIKVTNQRNPDLPLYIVVNRADSDKHGQKVYAKLAGSCYRLINKAPPLIGIIHQDRCVPESILKKTSTLSSHPTSQAARDIEKIAAELIRLRSVQTKNK